MARAVTDIDRGFKSLVRRFRRSRDGPNVTVGIQSTAAGLSRGVGFSNAALAAVHEFGSKDGTIPQRSFIRATVDRERGQINRLLSVAVKKVADPDGIRRGLGIVGEKVVAEMKRTINQSIDIVSLKPATIIAKGSSTPLIDTGVLKNSITWEIHKI